MQTFREIAQSEDGRLDRQFDTYTKMRILWRVNSWPHHKLFRRILAGGMSRQKKLKDVRGNDLNRQHIARNANYYRSGFPAVPRPCWTLRITPRGVMSIPQNKKLPGKLSIQIQIQIILLTHSCPVWGYKLITWSWNTFLFQLFYSIHSYNN